MAKLDGRVALVTGGARGMGEAHARALAAEGASDAATQAARYPIPRFGTSEEVAATMLHIVCDATYSTGSEFCVDGGIPAGISVGD